MPNPNDLVVPLIATGSGLVLFVITIIRVVYKIKSIGIRIVTAGLAVAIAILTSEWNPPIGDLIIFLMGASLMCDVIYISENEKTQN